MEFKDIISSGLLELYIVGIASKEEHVQVENWIKEYPEMKHEVETMQTTMESYAMSYAIPPDPSVKKTLLTKIGSTAKEDNLTAAGETKYPGKVYQMSSLYKWAAAACFILFLGSLALNYFLYNRYKASSSGLATAQQQLDQQKQVTAAMIKDMEVVSNKFAKPVALNGTPHAPDAGAKIYWMQNTGEVFVDPTNLPEAPPGKQYQLWAIVDDKPVDAGMISAKNGIYRMQKMKTFGKAQAFAITLEKAGGSATPDMNQMYVMAKI